MSEREAPVAKIAEVERRDERIAAARRRHAEDCAHALEHRCETVEGSQPRRIERPVWTVEDVDAGPDGLTADWDDDDLPDAVLEALEAVKAVEQEIGFGLGHHYRDPAFPLDEQHRVAIDGWIDYCLDICDALTTEQRQCWIDEYQFFGVAPPSPEEVRIKANFAIQKQLGAALVLTDSHGRPKADTARRQLAAGLLSDSELAEMYDEEFAKAMSYTPDEHGRFGAGVEVAESLKWSGVYDEYGQFRDPPLPDQSHLRRPGVLYHPVIHAEWSGWKAGTDGWAPLYGWEAGGWVDESDKAPKFAPLTERGYLDVLLGLKVGMRWNLRAARVEIVADGSPADVAERMPKRWTSIDDRNEAMLKAIFAERYVGEMHKPWRLSQRLWTDYRNAILSQNEIDPFVEWLESLPDWDGQERIELVLTRLGAPDDDLTAWASRYLFVAPIQRALEPGCALHEIPVLIGGQGIGQSVTIERLIPPEHRFDWHGDSLNLAEDHQKQAEAIQGRVLVEVSEMAGSTRAEIDSLKAFLTRTNDGQHRAAYARNPEPRPRRCAFVGTTNDTNPLPNDPTGNRRFVVVDCTSGTPVEASEQIAWIDGCRVDLWAEAWERHGRGEWPTARLPETLKPQQADRNAEYRYSDSTMEEWLESLAPAAAKEPDGGFTMRQIASRLGLTDGPSGQMVLSGRDQTRITKALKALGWERGRSTAPGDRSRRWRPPTSPLPVSEPPQPPKADLEPF